MPIPLGVVAEEGKHLPAAWNQSGTDYRWGWGVYERSGSVMFNGGNYSGGSGQTSYFSENIFGAAPTVKYISISGYTSVTAKLLSCNSVYNFVSAQGTFAAVVRPVYNLINNALSTFNYSVSINTSGGTFPLYDPIDTSGAFYYPFGNQIDSSNNVYMAAANYVLTGVTRSALVKLNSSGSVVWNKVFSSTRNLAPSGTKIVDANGNTYLQCSGTDGTTPTRYIEIYKFDSSGAIVYTKQIRSYYSFSVNGEKNLYPNADGSCIIVTMDTVAGGTSNVIGVFIISKLDASGTVVWSNTLTPSFTPSGNTSAIITCDVAGNIYAAVQIMDANQNATYVFKFDSTGTLLWQRILSRANATYPTMTLKLYLMVFDEYSQTYILSGTGVVSSNDTYSWNNRLNADGSNIGTIVNNANTWQYAATTEWTSSPSVLNITNFSLATDVFDTVSSSPVTVTLTSAANTAIAPTVTWPA